jgi:hypothetical protein
MISLLTVVLVFIVIYIHKNQDIVVDDVSVDKMKSGYQTNDSGMERFVACWHMAARKLLDERSGEVHKDDFLSFVTNFDEGERISLNDVETANKRLGVMLPASYLDFLSEIRQNRKDVEVARTQELPVIYSLEMIDYFPVLKKEQYLIWSKTGFMSGVDLSNAYGVDQEDFLPDGDYLRKLIVIGEMYSPEIILLNPNIITEDGEMEALYLHLTGVIRMPSFAELMRQLSYMETMRPGTMPPYSQERLEYSCAAELKLNDIWWR